MHAQNHVSTPRAKVADAFLTAQNSFQKTAECAKIRKVRQGFEKADDAEPKKMATRLRTSKSRGGGLALTAGHSCLSAWRVLQIPQRINARI
jgi:hypothetical protein